MPPVLRQTQLLVTARLRSLGVVPWLATAAWALFTAALEPDVLRIGGVRLREPATWVACGLLWLSLAAALPRHRTPSTGVRVFANCYLLGIVTAIVATIGWCLGFVSGSGEPAPGALTNAARFAAAMLPLTFGLSVDASTWTGKVLVAASAGPTLVALSEPWLTPRVQQPWLAAGMLSICACGLSMIAASREGAPRLPIRNHV